MFGSSTLTRPAGIRRDAFPVQGIGDAEDRAARQEVLEDTPDHRGLILLDCLTPRCNVVSIAIDAAARRLRDTTTPGAFFLPAHGPFRDLLAFHFGAERTRREDEPPDRRVLNRSVTNSIR